MRYHVIETYTFSGNAIKSMTRSIVDGTILNGAIIISGNEYHVVVDIDNVPDDIIYASINSQKVQEFRKHNCFRAYDLISGHLINDAARRKVMRGEQAKKDHHAYPMLSLGASDIASLVLRSVNGVFELHFGADGSYRAHLVDSECNVPDYYTLEWRCKSWLWVYDDDGKVAEVLNPGREIRIYQAGSFGCIIQTN